MQESAAAPPGVLVLVVGPSGAGKDTLIAAARRRLAGDPRIRFARRHITRPSGADAEDHIPLSDEAFADMEGKGRFALAWRAHGLGYGIGIDIEDSLAAGAVVVANVSRRIVGEACRRYGGVLTVEIDAPPAILAARLAARGREDEARIAERLGRAVPIAGAGRIERIVNDASVEAGGERLAALLLSAAAASAASPRT